MKTLAMLRLQWASWKLAKAQVQFFKSVNRGDDEASEKWAKIGTIEDQRLSEVLNEIRLKYGFDTFIDVWKYCQGSVACAIQRFFLERFPL